MNEMSRRVEVKPFPPEHSSLPAPKIGDRDDQNAVGFKKSGQTLQNVDRPGHMLQNVPKSDHIKFTQGSLYIIQRSLNELESGRVVRLTKAERFQPHDLIAFVAY